MSITSEKKNLEHTIKQQEQTNMYIVYSHACTRAKSGHRASSGEAMQKRVKPLGADYRNTVVAC